MALQKNIAATVDIPSRFRDYRFSGHVADERAGTRTVDENGVESFADAGKLRLDFMAATPRPPGQELVFGGYVEDIPDGVFTDAQRKNLRRLLRLALEHFRTKDGVTGTPDPDPIEPV